MHSRLLVVVIVVVHSSRVGVSAVHFISGISSGRMVHSSSSSSSGGGKY
jgi:hypothetical protein